MYKINHATLHLWTRCNNIVVKQFFKFNKTIQLFFILWFLGFQKKCIEKVNLVVYSIQVLKNISQFSNKYNF